jgi:Nif11 domain
MAVDSCAAFLRAAYADPCLRQQVKAMTTVTEVICLGGRSGYQFDASDLAVASCATGGPASGTSRPRPAREVPRLTHYEYDLDKLPGFAAVIDELPNLKIKPPAVNLAQFEDDLSAEDLASTGMLPASPQYLSWQAARREQAGPGGQRDFHLINLDEHVDHPGYDDYLAAKTRVVATLEDAFGDEVRFSGSMWYPPSSYRLWHTNSDQPGWRMYLIDFDGDLTDSEPASFFRYKQPGTSELVTLPDRPLLARFFKVEQEPSQLFWHCIVNATSRHRWSFGFAVPGTWLDAITAGT